MGEKGFRDAHNNRNWVLVIIDKRSLVLIKLVSGFFLLFCETECLLC